MTDKTLLQEARDALDKEHARRFGNTDGILKEGDECDTCDLITRLDAELAKVAEVSPSGLTEPWLTKELRDWWWTGTVEEGLSSVVQRILDQEKHSEPVVLDLSGAIQFDLYHIPYLRKDHVLAAIRDQLPGIEVRV